MYQFSKYRVITAGLILMFIFVIAAIYTNTKDIAVKKMQQNENPAIEQNVVQNSSAEVQEDISNNNEASANDDINNRILGLKDRIDNLEKTVFSQNNNDGGNAVRCTVKGVIDGDHIIPMSDSDAVRESKENNKEVLISCIFK